MHICAGHIGYYLFFSEETYCSDSNKDNNVYQNDKANLLDANARDISILGWLICAMRIFFGNRY